MGHSNQACADNKKAESRLHELVLHAQSQFVP
jgi:hypothetical protein